MPQIGITNKERVMAERAAKTAKERRERQPLGVMRKKMSLDAATTKMLETKGLVPRWINDEDHGLRLQNAISGGYDFVSSTGEMIVGDQVFKEDEKRRVRKLVGSHKDGSPKYSFLMAIKREFYNEDQAKKEEQNEMVDEAIKGATPPGLKSHGVAPDEGGTYTKNIQYEP